MSAETQTDNKRIAKNTLFLYFRMLLLMAVSLFTSRVVLDKLGVEDFGIYNIVGGVIFLFSFISGPMTEATQRFLNFYMGRQDSNGVRQSFNASQTIHIFIAAIILLLAETIGLWFVRHNLVIPDNRLDATLWVYHFSMFASVFLVLSFPYNAVIIAHEKMNVFAYISIFEAIAKLLVAYLLSVSPLDRLIFYAALLASVQVMVSLCYRFYCLRYFPEVKFQISDIPTSLYKQILSFSGWNFLGNIANVCLQQGTNILLNLFFGPSVNAAKAISVQVQNAVNHFCNNFQMAMRPQIVKSYAANEMIAMHKLIFRASRFSYLLVWFFALPIMLKADWILNLWLGNVPEYAATFVQYTMGFILVQSLANPLLTGSVATGNVKKIMSVIATFFIMIIPICYIALYLGYNPVIVFKIQMLMYLVAHVLRLFIVSSQVGFSKKEYLIHVVKPIMVVSILSTIATIAFIVTVPDIAIIRVLTIPVSWIFIIVCVVLFGITRNELKSIIKYILKKSKF